MKRSVIAAAAIMAVLASAVAGYRLGAGTWPIRSHELPGAQAARAETRAAERTVLYWKDPDGANEFSPEPKKAADGRDFVAVFEDEEPGFKDAKPQKPGGERKILYYRNPMGLPDISHEPKKDSMGMAYIPVYEGDEEEGPLVKIPAGKLQRTGVKSEPVTRRVLTSSVYAPGIVQADEHRQSVVALRFDAFLEGLEQITTGSKVRKGEPLMLVYGDALTKVGAEYVTQLGVRDADGSAQSRGSRQRLQNLGVPEEIINDIQRNKQVALKVVWPSPRDGYIIEHNVIEGMQAKAGDVLFRIADLSVVWVLADVAERDLGLIAPGQAVTVAPRGYPGRTFTGKVGLIYPVLNKETRTIRVRVDLPNPEGLLRPNMYADAVIATGGGAPVLAAPENAVIASGTRQIVILDRGEGRFEPRPVSTGAHGDGFVEIRDGVSEGDRVVTAANFLIDSESNLKAALQTLTAGGTQ